MGFKRFKSYNLINFNSYDNWKLKSGPEMNYNLIEWSIFVLFSLRMMLYNILGFMAWNHVKVSQVSMKYALNSGDNWLLDTLSKKPKLSSIIKHSSCNLSPVSGPHLSICYLISCCDEFNWNWVPLASVSPSYYCLVPSWWAIIAP